MLSNRVLRKHAGEALGTVGDQFWYCSIRGLDGAPPLFILDGNVLSAVDAMLRHRMPTPSSRGNKIAGLIQRLKAEPGGRVSDDFALVEAAQFGEPTGFRADTLIMRDTAFRVVEARPSDIYDYVASIQGLGFPVGYDKDLEKQLATTIDVLSTTFVPAYVSALVLERRLQQGNHQHLSEEDVLAA